MKTLYLIGGPMGVGKTTVCQRLKERLDNCAFLDGDWCWDMHPFRVTEETKAVALDNICHVLNNFLRCPAYENILFCWVMHEQEIIDSILDRLETGEYKVVAVSLVCDKEALCRRLRGDIDRGLRASDVVARSLERLPRYAALNTVKLDVTHRTAEETADAILAL